jgi:hypothetical protein
LGDCFIPEPDLLSSLDDATTILCIHHEDVDMYNNFMVSSIFHKSAIHSIDVRSNATNIDELQGWLHDPDFNQIKTVAVGCLVMLTVNINLGRGLANGTPASVQSISLDLHGQVDSITVTIHHSGKSLKLTRRTIQYKYTFNGKFYKSTFPLALAYAMTGHKCQGATICSKVLVDVRKAFSPGLTYVMLSRVTESRHLKIARQLLPDDFMSVLYTTGNSTISSS